MPVPAVQASGRARARQRRGHADVRSTHAGSSCRHGVHRGKSCRPRRYHQTRALHQRPPRSPMAHGSRMRAFQAHLGQDGDLRHVRIRCTMAEGYHAHVHGRAQRVARRAARSQMRTLLARPSPATPCRAAPCGGRPRAGSRAAPSQAAPAISGSIGCSSISPCAASHAAWLPPCSNRMGRPLATSLAVSPRSRPSQPLK